MTDIEVVDINDNTNKDVPTAEGSGARRVSEHPSSYMTEDIKEDIK